MTSGATSIPVLPAAGGSHAGLQRENNEDRFHCDPRRGIFMVIDGVGGHAAGEKAADTALAVIRARLERETGGPLDRIREAITLANNEIVRLAATEPAWAGMTCVLTVALVRDSRVFVGHVGDTRLYLCRGGALEKITHDHSPVGEREDQGELSELEAMRHPRRNEIYRDVGSQVRAPHDEGFIDTVEFPLDPDAAFVLCTDGLSDLVPSSRLASILVGHAADPPAIVERMIEAANEAGGKDNVTAVVVTGPQFPEAARRWSAAVAGGGASSRFAAAAARTMGAALASRPAMLGYGLAAGVALAAGLAVGIDRVSDRLLDTARPAGWARTWRVGTGPGADFLTIQEAFVRARPGDAVLAEAGAYPLPLVLPAGVSLVARTAREAVLRVPPGAAPGQAGVTAGRNCRLAGFKIDAAGLASAIVVRDEGAVIEDVEIVGAAEAAVVFGPRSRGVLRSSYLHDNLAAGVVAESQALPRLFNNVIAGNGLREAGAPPAVVLRADASAVFFGNIVAGNGDDQIAGLAPDRRADVLRDNVIGLGPAARGAAGARPQPSPPRRRNSTAR